MGRASTVDLPELNGAQRQRRRSTPGATPAEVYAETVSETHDDLPQEVRVADERPAQPAGADRGGAAPSSRPSSTASTSTTCVLQTIVSLINLGARKGAVGAPPEAGIQADNEQLRIAIEAARALLAIVEPRHGDKLGPFRTRSRQLQMAYAQQRRAARRAADGAGRRRRAPPQEPQGGPRAAGQAQRPRSGSRVSSRTVRDARAVSSRAFRGGGLRLPLGFVAVPRGRALAPAAQLIPEGDPLTEFLTDHGVVVALVCAAAAVLYGAVTARSLLALSPGNETMRSLSLAIQEGASAYLRRQYTTIGIVGVVLFVVLIPLQNIEVAVGFAIGGVASGAAGFIGMNVSVRANARVAEAARGGIGPALDVAFRGGAVTGMLVVGLALLGVAGYYGILTLDLRRRAPRRPSTRSSASASAAR